MVAQEDAPAGPLRDIGRLGEHVDEFAGVLGAQRVEDPRHDGEVERHVAFWLLLGAEEGGDLARPLVRLCDHDAARELEIDHGPQDLEEVVRRRLALSIALLRLVEVRDGIEPEAVDAHGHPEPDDLEDRLVHGRILEVEVGLVREEAMEVELAAHGVEGPVRVLGVGEDDADVGEALVAVAPHVEVAVRPLGVAPGLLEPLMLVRGVVEREVDDDPHVALMRLRHELLELVERAELGKDRVVVGDVVAAVAQRRREERRDPERIHPEPLQVVELRDEAAEIARTVPVAVEEGSHHDLVEHRSPVPLRIQGQPGKLDRCGEAHCAPSVKAWRYESRRDCKRLWRAIGRIRRAA